MNDINTMIKDILRANEENKLAIFIGAGVSVNSGYKSWWQIVDRFNKGKKYVDNSDRDYYTDEDILKIPQCAFQEDEELYFKILEEEYNKLPEDTNPIIDMLLQLQPNHIITTNYDRLVEFSIEKNHIYGNTLYEDFSRYSRIINDADFVCAKKPHYFIKMHGDLEDRSSIVLKEDDYLEFSTKHALIETFVKSLFVNHTILFVGYGLKDINLKLIMSWVNSFAKRIKDQDKISKYYYINVENTKLSKYEKAYYLSKNIHIIEASEIPEIEIHPEDKVEFADYRGENLYRVVQYLNSDIETSLDDLIAKLSAFDNINAITLHELYSVLRLPSSLSCLIDGIEYNLFQGQFINSNSRCKNLLSQLQNNPTSIKSQRIKSAFLKAGIKGIVISEKRSSLERKSNRQPTGILESFWMLPVPEYEILYLGDINYSFFDMVISHDFTAMLNALDNTSDTSNDIKVCLQQAYIYAYLWEDDKAKAIYKKIDERLQEKGISFDYVVTLYNLAVLDWDERYRIMHKNMSGKHKKQFHTLLQFNDDFPELMKKIVDMNTEIRKRITVNAITKSGDLQFSEFKKIRDEIYLTLRYLIDNYVFVLGLGGSHVFKKWFDIIEIYLDTVLRIMSPNSNMKVSNEYQYERITLSDIDIYFLTFYLDSSTLKFYFREHNISSLNLEDSQEDYLIELLANISRIDVLPKQPIHSKLAKLINSTLFVIGQTNFNAQKTNTIITQMQSLMINILKLDGDSDYTWFYETFSYWLECLYNLVKKSNRKDQIQECVKSLLLGILTHFYTSDTENAKNMGLQITVMKEQGILINMANLLEYYFGAKADDYVLIQFVERTSLYEHSEKNILANFIIELFPAMSEKMREHYRSLVYDTLSNLEIRYIRLALENKVVVYDHIVEQLLINACCAKVQQGISEGIGHEANNIANDPLYVILRLHEKGIINDLEPYKKFRGQDDLFDFVCFPKEFDYNKFNTDWSTWLTLESYSTIALNKAFDILKNKYEEKMLNAPTENDKLIYYKYFKG
jgi:hypothetical protein